MANEDPIASPSGETCVVIVTFPEFAINLLNSLRSNVAKLRKFIGFLETCFRCSHVFNQNAQASTGRRLKFGKFTAT